MALTDDEKKKIIELYGKGYSYRKIADMTGYSETTISEVVQDASKEVLNLYTKYISVEQIAAQTGYSVDFVKRVIKIYTKKLQRQEMSKKEEKSEPETEETDEPKKLDVKADWNEFQKKSEIERRKENVRKDIAESLKSLKQMDVYYRDEAVVDNVYETRYIQITDKINNFVSKKIDVVDSIEAINELEKIMHEIDKSICALFSEYDSKQSERRKAQSQQEKEYSDKLINSRINIPLYSNELKEFIKDNFIVKNEQKADVIKDALYEFALMMDTPAKTEGEVDKTYHALIGMLKDGGWKYLEKLASEYRNRPFPDSE